MDRLSAIVITVCLLFGMVAVLVSVFLIALHENLIAIYKIMQPIQKENKCATRGGTFIPMSSGSSNASCVGNSKTKE